MESPYCNVAADLIGLQPVIRAIGDIGTLVPVMWELEMPELTVSTSRKPMDLPLAKVPEGRVHVISERCKECNFCINYCPTEVLEYSKDINAKGYHFPIVANGKESSCVHCKFCDLICPELAIYTTEVTDDEVTDKEGLKADA